MELSGASAFDQSIAYYEATYRLVDARMILTPDTKVRLGQREEKHCRFCGKSSPEVTFKQETHALPEAIGNKSIVIHYECDTCNQKFGAGIETEFGKWSKPLRTFYQIAGKNGVPTLKRKGPRLLEVRFLMEAGVPTAAVHLLSNHYNVTRTDYYRRLSETSKNGGDLTGFIFYATKGLVDQLRMQLRFVKYQQWGLAWESYFTEALGNKRTNSARRQHMLLDALSSQANLIPKTELRHLTPQLAEMYATKTPKTLSRDLNELTKKGLITIENDNVRANKKIILAFLPGARAEDREAQREESVRLTNENGQFLFDF